MEEIREQIKILEKQIEDVKADMQYLEEEYFMTGDRHEREGIEIQLMHLENELASIEDEIGELMEQLQ